MRRDAGIRLFVCASLFVVLFGMFVHYGAVAGEDGHDQTNLMSSKIESYEQHLGEEVAFWAPVTATNEDSMVVLFSDRKLTVTGYEKTVSDGDLIQVTGTVHEGGVVTADRIVRSERGNLIYLYAISAIGFLVALGAVLRSWRIRWRSLQLEPRRKDDG